MGRATGVMFTSMVWSLNGSTRKAIKPSPTAADITAMYKSAKHFEESRQTFRGMLSNVPRNVVKYSGECRKASPRMS